MPLRVGVNSQRTLWMPSPSTTSIRSSCLLKTTTSIICPLLVIRTGIFSLFMRVASFHEPHQLRRPHVNLHALLHERGHLVVADVGHLEAAFDHPPAQVRIL